MISVKRQTKSCFLCQINKSTKMEKCSSLRFEDRKPCLSNSRESSKFCRHHEEIYECLKIVNEHVDHYIEKRRVVIKYVEDFEAVDEVKLFMHEFQQAIMLGSDTDHWWMENRDKKRRRYGQCYSLELRTGELCEEVLINRKKYCRFHFIQHQIMCEAYHLMRMDMKMKAVSFETLLFVEFMLRTEFSKLFIGEDDFEHIIRLANLYNGGIFAEPYPPENFAAIDVAFYAIAEKYSGAANRCNYI